MNVAHDIKLVNANRVTRVNANFPGQFAAAHLALFKTAPRGSRSACFEICRFGLRADHITQQTPNCDDKYLESWLVAFVHF